MGFHVVIIDPNHLAGVDLDALGLGYGLAILVDGDQKTPLPTAPAG
jgi:hypothetical protein